MFPQKKWGRGQSRGWIGGSRAFCIKRICLFKKLSVLQDRHFVTSDKSYKRWCTFLLEFTAKATFLIVLPCRTSCNFRRAPSFSTPHPLQTVTIHVIVASWYVTSSLCGSKKLLTDCFSCCAVVFFSAFNFRALSYFCFFVSALMFDFLLTSPSFNVIAHKIAFIYREIMSFNIGFSGEYNESPYGFITHGIPRSYHRQPGSPDENTSSGGVGGEDHSPLNIPQGDLDFGLLSTQHEHIPQDQGIFSADPPSASYSSRGATVRHPGPLGTMPQPSVRVSAERQRAVPDI